jgi:hypothetical protein
LFIPLSAVSSHEGTLFQRCPHLPTCLVPSLRVLVEAALNDQSERIADPRLERDVLGLSDWQAEDISFEAWVRDPLGLFIQRCLHKNPETRYQTGREVRAALEEGAFV